MAHNTELHCYEILIHIHAEWGNIQERGARLQQWQLTSADTEGLCYGCATGVLVSPRSQ